ncbi:hypothetical protein GCG21_11965 [Pseudactinotalea sp. HY160]|uniref:hypothetical protein n=1 Tax=Pseudactinotalea sp. HY160 TaxID=2654490 RepID=UPI00128B5F87|nr:hypothetical protein [Pseudactinotalea sp. HY160]MPV50708.1 hypothetical protein [Pseudactinotalea sp. HY160]
MPEPDSSTIALTLVVTRDRAGHQARRLGRFLDAWEQGGGPTTIAYTVDVYSRIRSILDRHTRIRTVAPRTAETDELFRAILFDLPYQGAGRCLVVSLPADGRIATIRDGSTLPAAAAPRTGPKRDRPVLLSHEHTPPRLLELAAGAPTYPPAPVYPPGGTTRG